MAPGWTCTSCSLETIRSELPWSAVRSWPRSCSWMNILSKPSQTKEQWPAAQIDFSNGEVQQGRCQGFHMRRTARRIRVGSLHHHLYYQACWLGWWGSPGELEVSSEGGKNTMLEFRWLYHSLPMWLINVFKLFGIFWIYFSKPYRPLGSWLALVKSTGFPTNHSSATISKLKIFLRLHHYTAVGF